MAANGQGAAEIWVKVDTVFGNNATQYIAMHRGNASADAVKGGFQGVWHLGQPGNTIACDATANGYDGTPFNMTAASAVPGIIGANLQFVPQGNNEGYACFKGKLDEIRVASVPRCGDWIKLCYMNPKANDALVVFENR